MPSSCQPTPGSTIPFWGCPCQPTTPTKALNQYFAGHVFAGYGPVMVVPVTDQVQYTRFRIIQSGSGSGQYVITIDPLSSDQVVSQNNLSHPNWRSLGPVIVNATPTDCTFSGGGVITRYVIDTPYTAEETHFQALLDEITNHFGSLPGPTGNRFEALAAGYDFSGNIEVAHPSDIAQFLLPTASEVCSGDAYYYRKILSGQGTITTIGGQQFYLDGPTGKDVHRVWARAEIAITAPWYKRTWDTVGLYAPDGFTVVNSENCDGEAGLCEIQTVPGTSVVPAILSPTAGPNEYAQSATHTACP